MYDNVQKWWHTRGTIHSAGNLYECQRKSLKLWQNASLQGWSSRSILFFEIKMFHLCLYFPTCQGITLTSLSILIPLSHSMQYRNSLRAPLSVTASQSQKLFSLYTQTVYALRGKKSPQNESGMWTSSAADVSPCWRCVRGPVEGASRTSPWWCCWRSSFSQWTGLSTAPTCPWSEEAADLEQGWAAETGASLAAFQCKEGSPARRAGTGTTLSVPCGKKLR